MRPTLSLLALGVLIAAVPAHAASITYTESTTASGSFDGTTFTNALITFTATGSTTNVTQPASGIFASVLPTTVTVAGLGSDLFTDAIEFIDNQGADLAGVADKTANLGILFTDNLALATYTLQSAIGPLSGTPSYTNAHAYATARGTFTLNSPVNSSTFQATLPTTVTTPEPSSLLLLGTGTLGLAGALRRKLSR